MWLPANKLIAMWQPQNMEPLQTQRRTSNNILLNFLAQSDFSKTKTNTIWVYLLHLAILLLSTVVCCTSMEQLVVYSTTVFTFFLL